MVSIQLCGGQRSQKAELAKRNVCLQWTILLMVTLGKAWKYCFCVKGLLLPVLEAFPRQFVPGTPWFPVMNRIWPLWISHLTLSSVYHQVKWICCLSDFIIFYVFTRVNCSTTCRTTKKSIHLFVPWVLCATERWCFKSELVTPPAAAGQPSESILCCTVPTQGGEGAAQGPAVPPAMVMVILVDTSHKDKAFKVRLLHRPINCLWECSGTASHWLLPSRTGHLLGDNVAGLKHSTNLVQRRWLGLIISLTVSYQSTLPFKVL